MEKLNSFGKFLSGVFNTFINENIENHEDILHNILKGNLRTRRYYQDYDKRIYHYSLEDTRELYPAEVNIDFVEINWRIYKVYNEDKINELLKFDPINLIRLMVYISKNKDCCKLKCSLYDYANQEYIKYSDEDLYKTLYFLLSSIELIMREYSVEMGGIEFPAGNRIDEYTKRNISKFKDMNILNFIEYIEGKYKFNCLL